MHCFISLVCLARYCNLRRSALVMLMLSCGSVIASSVNIMVVVNIVVILLMGFWFQFSTFVLPWHPNTKSTINKDVGVC